MKKCGLVLAMALVLPGAGIGGEGPGCPAPACHKEKSCFSLCKKKDCVKKECVRVPDTKKHTHVEYGRFEEDICKPWCHFCKKLKCGHDQKCDDCGKDGKCNDCGKTRTRRKLVKKIIVEEQCTTKCVPVVKEDCCPIETAAPPAHPPVQVIPGTTPEVIPVQPGTTPEVVPTPPGTVDPMPKPTPKPEVIPIPPGTVIPMPKPAPTPMKK